MTSMYYDGTKLLSLKDINGLEPDLYLCTTNRTAGKTTYFSRLLVNRFVKRKEKFGLIYRFKYELDDIPNKFFKDINSLFFPDLEMKSQVRAKGIYHELFLNNIACGYALSLNCADTLKKYSHIFSDISSMFMDEFQSETGHYCPNEVEKFISLHTSVARGQGKMNRRVPVYMCGNPVTLLNPYYVALGISSKLQKSTHFLRGDGFVLEQGYSANAEKAQRESAFNRAFSENSYTAYTAQGVYLNDNDAFVEKIIGIGKYIATIKYNGKSYAIREFQKQGIIYCDNQADESFPFRLAVTTDDHNVNYVMMQNNLLFIDRMRYFFERGCFRFKDLSCKNAIISMLSF